MADTILTSGRRSGKTILIERARYEWTRANPTGVTIEIGIGGHVRVEKPFTEEDLVPELPCEVPNG